MSVGGNWLKTWLQSSANKIAVQRAYQAMRVMGRALPCSVVSVSGSFVTVKFEVLQPPFTLPQVTIPKAESTWIRNPTQVGDFGIAVPAETFLGGVTGQGGGVASLALQGNLSTLYFLPLANTDFTPCNINAALVQGPQGAVIQTSDGNVVLTLNESGLTLVIGGVTILVVNSVGATLTGNLNVTESITANTGSPGNTVGLTTHRHTQGVDSRGDTEQEVNPPVPGT